MVGQGAPLKIAVLALQGDFEKHITRLLEIGARACSARTAAEIDSSDGVVLPGGESTTIGKLLTRYKIDEAIERAHKTGKPIFGTCAGMILLAKEIAADTQERGGQTTLRLMDITIARNGYGRQIESFETVLPDSSLPGTDGDGRNLEAVFIRAPLILSHGANVNVLARRDGSPVLVQQGNLLAAAFHPELTADKRVHEYFLSLANQ